ncbi:MAG: flagellar biosynthetic protein FliR [Desulfobacteraceae bacterium]|nr:flagellar biosynthetic protein FliR [Desulfobacteraceae bacterium]
MEILNLIQPGEFKLYMLVLARVSIVLFMLPIFSSTMFPAMLKTGLAMVIAMLLYSVVDIDPASLPGCPLATGLFLIGEAMIGLTLGLCVRLFFGAFQLAGQVIGFQMGFSMINVVDPQSGANVSIMEQLAYWVALLVFLLLNGHHIMLLALVDSFDLIQPGQFVFQRVMVDKMLFLGAQMFVLSIKIGAPAIAALLFTSVAFGLTAKFSPQMNVMIVAFPLKIVVGLVLFGLSLEIIKLITKGYIYEFKALLMKFMFWIGGG